MSANGYTPKLPALDDDEEATEIVRQGGAPNRLRQVLAHQHPVHEVLGKVFNNLGSVTGMTDWAEENKTEFYKLMARTAPTPKEQTFISINNGINEPDTGVTYDAEKVAQLDPNQTTAAYVAIMKSGPRR